MHHLRQRGAPRQALPNRALLSSDTNAMDQLQDFLRQRRDAHEPVETLDACAHERHRLFVTAARAALSQELSRFDLDVPVVEVDGERDPRVLRCDTTSPSAAGPVRVKRSVYRPPPGRAHLVPASTARRDHRGRVDPVSGNAGHLGRGACDAQRGRRTLCPVGAHDSIATHARSMAPSAECPLGDAPSTR